MVRYGIIFKMEEIYEDVIKKLDKLYLKLAKETTTKGLKIVGEIVEWEIEAERFCNE